MKKLIFILIIVLALLNTNIYAYHAYLYDNYTYENYDKIYRSQIEISFSEQKLLYDICQDFEVDNYEALAIYMVENPTLNSKIKHKNKNGTYDWGDFQINDINHKELIDLGYIYDSSDLLIRKNNFKCAIYLLSKLNKYSKEERIIAYNCGEQGMKNLFKKNITETPYSKKVLEYYNELKGGL